MFKQLTGLQGFHFSSDGLSEGTYLQNLVDKMDSKVKTISIRCCGFQFNVAYGRQSKPLKSLVSSDHSMNEPSTSRQMIHFDPKKNINMFGKYHILCFFCRSSQNDSISGKYLLHSLGSTVPLLGKFNFKSVEIYAFVSFWKVCHATCYYGTSVPLASRPRHPGGSKCREPVPVSEQPL